MEQLIQFFQHITDLINNFADNSDSFWERIIIWIIVTYLELKIHIMQLSYSIVTVFFNAINLSALINSAWGSLDSQILGALTYLRIPESLNVILSALATRYVMDLIP